MSQNSEVSHVPWNKGRLIGPKPPLKPKHVWGIRIRLQLAGATRDLAMFDLAIDSKLRGCDLVRLKIGDVALNGMVRSRATVVQQKTGHPVQFEITEQTRESVGRWIRQRSGCNSDYLFPSRVRPDLPISTRQYEPHRVSWRTRFLREWGHHDETGITQIRP